MITRGEVCHLISGAEYMYPLEAVVLANEIREKNDRNEWQPRVEGLIEKVVRRRRNKNPSRTVAFLARALKITTEEFEKAHDAYALQRITLGDPYVCYDSFDTIEMMAATWVARAIEIYGECVSEVVFLYLLSEEQGPFKPLNWFKLRLTKQV